MIRFLLAWTLMITPAAASDLPTGFVRLADVAPQIAQDIRYATPDNFTGAVVPGYAAPVCILTRAAADALIRAHTALAPDGYGLKVFDCYRPRRAVAAFVAFVHSETPAPHASLYHPDIPKSRLIADGYISARSAHSRGSTVDLTLTKEGAEVDMGTIFDFFGPASSHGAQGIAPEPTRLRARLRRAMESAGFRAYAKEWWHYTLRDEPFPTRSFDIEVQ
jgi:D-alanyl-D-alanine dipeptidase